MKPWLLEVNVLPSLSSSSPFDKIVKTLLICDVLTIVGIRGYDKKKVNSEEEKRNGSKCYYKYIFFRGIKVHDFGRHR